LSERERSVATTKGEAAAREKPRPVLMKRGTAEAILEDPQRTGAFLLLTLGGGLTLFELVRLGLLWLPLQLGIAAWVFGTVTATFDVLPLMGLGAALTTWGLVHWPDVRPATIRTAAMAFAIAMLLILLAATLYVGSVPTVVAEAPEEARVALRRSIAETGSAITISTVVSSLVAVVLWRSIRKGDG
jgi:hypothetical protein